MKGHQLRGDKSCEQGPGRERPHRDEDDAEHQHGQRQLSQFACVGRPDQGTSPGIPASQNDPRCQKCVRNYASQATEQRRVARHVSDQPPEQCGEDRSDYQLSK